MDFIDAFILGFRNDPTGIAEMTRDAVVAAKASKDHAMSPWTSVLNMPYDDPRGFKPTPTPEAVRCCAYAALIRGAKGLEYYPYHQGTYVQDRVPLVWSLFKALNQEVQTLAPVLFSEDGPQTVACKQPGDDVIFLQKTCRGATYVLAANLSGAGAVDAEFTFRMRPCSAPHTSFGAGTTVEPPAWLPEPRVGVPTGRTPWRLSCPDHPASATVFAMRTRVQVGPSGCAPAQPQKRFPVSCTKDRGDLAIMTGRPAMKIGTINPDSGRYVWFAREGKA